MAISTRTSPVAEATPVQALVDDVAQSDRGAALRRRLERKYDAPPDDVLDAYWAAYVSVRNAKSLRGTTEAEVASYLARAVENRLIDELRRRKHERPASDELIAAVAPAATDSVDTDLLDADNPVELEPVVAAIANGLSERQRMVLSLFCRDAPRREIAERLDISERRAKKDIEAILKKSRRTLLRLAGGGCADGEAPTTRLAFGLLSGAEAVTAAQAHLATCAACERLYERLDLFRDKAAALLPVPAVDRVEPGFAARAAHKASEIATSVKGHAIDGRRQVLEGSQQIKAHATSKLIDPTPLSGLRPGSALAVVGSCVAVGTGAGACLKEGVNPLRSVADAVSAQEPADDRSGKDQAVSEAGATPRARRRTRRSSRHPQRRHQRPTPQRPPRRFRLNHPRLPSRRRARSPRSIRAPAPRPANAYRSAPAPATPQPAPATGSKEFEGP